MPAPRKPAAPGEPAGAAAKKAPAKQPAASKAKPGAKKPAATSKSAPPEPKPAEAAKAAPRVRPKPAERRSRRTAAARTTDEAARDVALFDSLGALRDALTEHLAFTRDRLQETLDDAVRRGRLLPDEAQDLAQRIGAGGRRQLDDLLAELDRRLGPRR